MSSKWGTNVIAVAAAAIIAGGALTGCGGKAQQDEGKTGSIRDPLNSSVTDVYGPLSVRVGEFEATSTIKPWSAWWMPINETYLFDSESGKDAPLQKYDLYSKNVLDKESHAARFQREKLYDARAVSWEGHCDAWAMASILEPEPKSPVDRGGVSFGIGDQKALLMLTYEKFSGSRGFGQRYNADRTSRFDDIAPDQFHRFIQAELFEKGRPFIMDKDPSYPVWNTPVWSAQVRIVADAKDKGVLHVETWLLGADPWVDSYDYVGTRQISLQYTYDLVGGWDTHGAFHVDSGYWTGKSMDYHPDYLTAVPPKGDHYSRNTELDAAVVYKIIGN